ncbi:kinetochore-associated protein DSN1 homolog [Aulostomus maculatus]
MAEKNSSIGGDGCEGVATAEAKDESAPIQVNSMNMTPKRCSSTSPSTAPPRKSPRTDSLSPTTLTSDPGEGLLETDKQEIPSVNTEEPSVSPSARRKSWRRATITRRSLPALPNPYQTLSRNISTSLPQQERLEKLMEASVKLAIERLQTSLKSLPNSSPESFQKQVENMQKELSSLTKSTESQSQQLPVSATRSSDPSLQRAMENIQTAINRLQAESESWEALLNKHRSRAEELDRKLAQGPKSVVSSDCTTMAQSSQYQVIQSKPDYRSLLSRQQPVLHTMAMIMDTQCKMVQELLSIKEQARLMVKEASGRLAAEAGFQDLSPNVIKSLMMAPLSSATT